MILKLENPEADILRDRCDDVSSFGTKELAELASNMIETMYCEGGVGLSAPQVGVKERIVVIDSGQTYGADALVAINPIVVSKSEQITEMKEGCLSFPKLEISTLRSRSVVVRYQDQDGNFFESTFSGLSSHIVQHEIDHLNGITILSRASRLKRGRYLKSVMKKRKLEL